MKQKQKPAENPEQIEYRKANKDLKDAELRMALRSRGINPYELSQKDIDEIRRHINKMQQVDASTKSKMIAIEQEGKNEQAVISNEIEVIVARVYQEQNHMPPAPELHIAEGQPEAGQEEVSIAEPDKEQVDKEVLGGSGDTGAGGVGEDRSASEPIKPE
ncbi:hypothetical protein KKE60_05770 [Patescibacteria group bacterium]|nr:hypothetical protein [Patescibacteria group bacterium]